MNNQNVESMMNGLATSLNSYLGMNIQDKRNQATEERKNTAALNLKSYESALDTQKGMSIENYKTSLEDAIKAKSSITLSQLKNDPEFAPLAEMAPDARLDAKDLLGYLKDRKKAEQEKQPKEFQYKAANYYKLAQGAEDNLSTLSKRLDLGSWAPLGRTDSKYMPEMLRGEDWKQFMTARKAYTEAYLRPATGATINPEEYANMDKIFIPLPGDSPKVQAGKKANRDGLRTALKSEAEGKQVDLSVFKPVVDDGSKDQQAQMTQGQTKSGTKWRVIQ